MEWAYAAADGALLQHCLVLIPFSGISLRRSRAACTAAALRHADRQHKVYFSLHECHQALRRIADLALHDHVHTCKLTCAAAVSVGYSG
jgi:hypothetical protein